MKRLMIYSATIVMFFSLLAFVSAGVDCSEISKATNTAEFIEEIPSINNALEECEAVLPSSAGFLISSGNILASIEMNDGTTKDFHIVLDKKRFVSIKEGSGQSFKFKAIIDEETLDKIISSEDSAAEALAAYEAGKIKVEAKGIVNKIKLMIAKMFI
jgi:hypothetical protein